MEEPRSGAFRSTGWALRTGGLIVGAFVLLVILGALFGDDPDEGDATLDAAAASSTRPTSSTTERIGDSTGEPGGEPAPEEAPSAVPAVPDLDEPSDDDEVDALLDLLDVEPEGPSEGYDRDLFSVWSTNDDGCSTREQVLIDEAIGNVQTDVGCTVVAGDWMSVYDGVEVDDPAELEIDHVVALHEAWQSGAAAWDDTRREAFANDLDDPATLVAVTSRSNQQKSDRDPAEWRPTRRAAWCGFAQDWVAIKVRWELTADTAEVRSLRDLLTACFEEDETAPTTSTTTTRPATTVAPTTPPTSAPPPAPPPSPAPATPSTTPPPPPTPAPTLPPPPPPPPPTQPSGCDPNYSGCVPIASDVDCAGGSGNGPAYASGPIQVIGSDVYDLDADGDGIACEP